MSSGTAASAIVQQPTASAGVRLNGLKAVDVVQIAFDLLALTAAWHISFHLRLAMNPLMSIQLDRMRLQAVAPPLQALLALWTAISVWLIATGGRRREAGSLNVFRLAESTLLASAIAVIATFYTQALFASVSRSFILVFSAVSYATLIVARAAEHVLWIRIAKTWPALLERVAIVGTGRHAEVTADRIRKTETGAAELIGLIVPQKAGGARLNGAPVLGSTAQLAELINAWRLTRVVVLNGCLSETEFDRCSAIGKRMGVVLSRELSGAGAGVHVRLDRRFGMQLVDWLPVSFTRAEEVAKRLIDIPVSLFSLLLFSPVLLLCAVLVKLTSPGPVLYCSKRVGKGGRYFTFYKFRTMFHDPRGRRLVADRNERGGHIFKIKRDPRITPVGRILRRFSLDELPQLFNVLNGDMSLLGPRPLPAEDLDPDGMSREHPMWTELRALVKPGITGLWQVRGRSDLSFEQMIQLDLEYIENWSLWLDLKILLATPLVVITGRGAY